jgi:hypothetical protein
VASGIHCVGERIEGRDVAQPLGRQAKRKQNTRQQQDGKAGGEDYRRVNVLVARRQRDRVRDRRGEQADQRNQRQRDEHPDRMDAQPERQGDQDQDQRLDDDREHVTKRAPKQQSNAAHRRHTQPLDHAGPQLADQAKADPGRAEQAELDEQARHENVVGATRWKTLYRRD